MGGARASLKRGPGSLYRSLKSLEYMPTRDRRAALELALTRDLREVPMGARRGRIRPFLRATHELLADARFGRGEVGSEPPLVEGLGESNLLTLVRK